MGSKKKSFRSLPNFQNGPPPLLYREMIQYPDVVADKTVTSYIMEMK